MKIQFPNENLAQAPVIAKPPAIAQPPKVVKADEEAKDL